MIIDYPGIYRIRRYQYLYEYIRTTWLEFTGEEMCVRICDILIISIFSCM